MVVVPAIFLLLCLLQQPLYAADKGSGQHSGDGNGSGCGTDTEKTTHLDLSSSYRETTVSSSEDDEIESEHYIGLKKKRHFGSSSSLQIITLSSSRDNESDDDDDTEDEEHETTEKRGHLDPSSSFQDFTLLSSGDDDEVEIVGTKSPDFSLLSFTPGKRVWQLATSERLGIIVRRFLDTLWENYGGKLTSPTKTQRIRGDGNCFFRAIAFCITGNEDDHKPIRQAVVKHMREHMKEGETEENINKMAEDRTWATTFAILATAQLLKTPLFVYTPFVGKTTEWKWIQYTPNGNDTPVYDDNIPRIYLKHVNNNHYDVVTKVWGPDTQKVSPDRKKLRIGE